jgi:hypothetical protein
VLDKNASFAIELVRRQSQRQCRQCDQGDWCGHVCLCQPGNRSGLAH